MSFPRMQWNYLFHVAMLHPLWLSISSTVRHQSPIVCNFVIVRDLLVFMWCKFLRCDGFRLVIQEKVHCIGVELHRNLLLRWRNWVVVKWHRFRSVIAISKPFRLWEYWSYVYCSCEVPWYCVEMWDVLWIYCNNRELPFVRCMVRE